MAVDTDLKYYRLEWNAASSNPVLGLHAEKTSALSFLEDIQKTLKEGHEIQLQVKDKSLKDIVDGVVAGCQAKIGILGVIWNCVLRILCITPAIDDITKLATEIQNAEMTSTGVSVFFFQAQLTKILDFFKKLPQEEMGVFFGPALMGDYNQCINAPLNTIADCLECGKKLWALFEKYDSEYMRLTHDPSPIFTMEMQDITAVRNALNELFFIAAKAAFKDENLDDAAEAMSKVSSPPTPEDEEFIGELVRGCLTENNIPNAQLAVLQLVCIGNIEIYQKEIMQAMLQREPMRAENIQAAFNRVRFMPLFAQKDFNRMIIDKCLEKNDFYDQAIEAASKLSDYDALAKIGSHCIDQQDFANAKKAIEKIWTLDIKGPLIEKMVRYYINKNDHENAINALTFTSISLALEDQLSYEIANKCIEGKNFKAAATAHSMIFGKLPEYQAQARVIFDKCREAKEFESVVSVAGTIIEEEDIRQQLLAIVEEILTFKVNEIHLFWKYAYAAQRIAQLLKDPGLEGRVLQSRNPS